MTKLAVEFGIGLNFHIYAIYHVGNTIRLFALAFRQGEWFEKYCTLLLRLPQRNCHLAILHWTYSPLGAPDLIWGRRRAPERDTNCFDTNRFRGAYRHWVVKS